VPRSLRWMLTASMVIALASLTVAARAQADDDNLPDPSKVSPADFQTAIERLTRSLAPEADASLTEPAIDWILEADGSLRGRRLEVPEESQAFTLIGLSYQRQDDYAPAVEYFLRANDACRLEGALWLLARAHPELYGRPGPLVFSGSAPECGPQTAHPVHTTNEIFAASARGPVYRIDRRRRTHAAIFASSNPANGPISLAWENERLRITLKNGDRYQFDTRTGELMALSNVRHPQQRAAAQRGGGGAKHCFVSFWLTGRIVVPDER